MIFLSSHRGKSMKEKDLRELLSEKNEAFKKLHLKHQRYEKQLKTLKAKSFLTEGERIKEKELKKKKLALKDKMYFMMKEYRKNNS
jgi:uncharacterized protein YdcH (DUF465 family)